MKKLTKKKKGILIGAATAVAVAAGTVCAVIFGIRKKAVNKETE
jgi:hypothetical protein